MRIKLIIAICLLLNIGLTLGRNIHNNKTKSQKAPEAESHVRAPVAEKEPGQADVTAFNPLADLFGLTLPLIFGEEDKSDYGLGDQWFPAYDEHKQAMDSMDKVFDEHQQQVDAMNKELQDLHTNVWSILNGEDTNGQSAQIVGNRPSHHSKSTSGKKAVPVFLDKEVAKEGSSRSKSGLPVFHPNRTNSAISSQSAEVSPNSGEHKPIINQVQYEINDQINGSIADPLQEMTLDLKWDLEDNRTRDNDTLLKIYEELMADPQTQTFAKAVSDSIFDTFDSLVQLWSNTLDTVLSNATNVTNDELMVVTEQVGEGFVGLKLVECNCPEAQYGRHKEDCPMNVEHMAKSKDAKETTNADYEVVPPILWQPVEDLTREGLGIYEQTSPLKYDTLPDELPDYPPLTIEHKFDHNFHFDDDDDLEWYDWVLVGAIALTTTILLAMGLIMCLNRKKSKSVELESNEEKCETNKAKAVKQKENYNKNIKYENSVKNENFANKNIEKIKTIFVNMRS